jgi:ribosomal protein S27AE
MPKEIFNPEKCPNCGNVTVVEHYDEGWRVVCDCGYYGIFHFDLPEETMITKGHRED